MSEEQKSFIEKLVFVQDKLNAPKSQVNEYGGFKYRSLEDINSGLKPLLAEMGLGLTITDEIMVIGDRFYIKAVATLSDGEDEITVNGFAREPLSKPKMDESQTTGSASSYARKYALNGLFLIDDSQDPDSMNNSSGPQANNSAPTQGELTKTQLEIAVNKMQEFAVIKNLDLSNAVSNLFSYLEFQAQTIDNLSANEFGKLMNYLNKYFIKHQQNQQQTQQTSADFEWGK